MKKTAPSGFKFKCPGYRLLFQLTIDTTHVVLFTIGTWIKINKASKLILVFNLY